jgi:protease-4
MNREEYGSEEIGQNPASGVPKPFCLDDAKEILRMGANILREERNDQYKRERARSRHKWLIVLLVVAFVTGFMFFGDESEKIPIDQATYKILPVFGGGKGKAHVAIIPVSGEISGDLLGPPQFSNTTRYISEALELAKDEKNLVAVIFYINSQGGDAVASEQGYRLIKQFREQEKEVNVVAYVSQGAFSGGYYLALGAGKIIADPAAEVGNIGVIMHLFNTYEIGRTFGVKEFTIKTGPHKDAGSQWKEDNAADRAMMQRTADVTFHRFLGAVSESRNIPLPQLERESKKQNGSTSGAFFGADDAKEKGLIDAAMTSDQLMDEIAETIGGMKKYHAVEFIRYDKKLPVIKEWENSVTAHTAQFARVFMRGILKEMEQQGHSLRAE